MKTLHTWLIALLCIWLLTAATGCHKHPVPPTEGEMYFYVHYNIDGTPLIFDSINYTNAAGNKYSITRLEFYISNITLFRKDKNPFITSDVHYLSARQRLTSQIKLEGVPIGHYTGISFHIGLVTDTNNTGSLPGTLENVNMAWPEPMGGGYHFLKMEGYFLDSLSNPTGFAVHVGTDTCLINVTINQPFEVIYHTPEKFLNMNLNEWFDHPTKYDLSDGNYTMGIEDKMLIISKNGSNVFTME